MAEEVIRRIGYRKEFKFIDSNQCPICGSTNIELTDGEIAFADGEDIDYLCCNKCEHEWSERSDGFINVTK